MAIRTYLADDIFNITYQTSKVSGVSTGFNLTVGTAPHNKIDGEVTVGIDDNGVTEYKLGSKKGIVLSDGTVESRSHSGISSVVVDPILDLFKKAVVVGNSNSYLEKATASSPNGGNKDFIVLLNHSQVIEANQSLATGDVASFLDTMVGLDGGKGNGVVIKYDKATESPVVKKLSSLRNGGGVSSQGSFFTNQAFYNNDGLYTVESIFRSTVLQLGLELYWERDNIYSLEPPRLTNPDAIVQPNKIDNTDIIEMNTVTDPYNIPDLIIPSTFMPDIIGASGVSAAAKTAIEGGIVSKLEGKRSMKIVTYEIPSFLFNPVKIAMQIASDSKDSIFGPIKKLTDPDALKSAVTFFGSHARRTKEAMLNRGGCNLVFRPDISIPHTWYNINGTEMYVTDIRHNISRQSATTSLTIIGIRNKLTETTDTSSSKGEEHVEKAESSLLVPLNDQIEKEVKDIKRKVDSTIDLADNTSSDDVESVFDYNGQNISKEEVDIIFGSEDEIKEVLSSVSDVHKTIRL